MNWAKTLADSTGYSPDIFTDVLYIQEGKVIHILYQIIDRITALKIYPQQEMIHWPRGSMTNKFQCMCGRLVEVGKGISNIEMLANIGGPCRFCLQKIPFYMCEKAILELVGQDQDEWIHADTLRIGRIKWRA